MSIAEPGSVAATAWVADRLGRPTEGLDIRTVDVGLPGPSQVRVASEFVSLDFNDIDTVDDATKGRGVDSAFDSVGGQVR